MSQNRLPGIANPQNTKGLGHFLTTDCKSVETPNGKNELYCGCGCFRIKAPTSIVLTVPVPADLKSAVKEKVRPMKTGDL